MEDENSVQYPKCLPGQYPEDNKKTQEGHCQVRTSHLHQRLDGGSKKEPQLVEEEESCTTVESVKEVD